MARYVVLLKFTEKGLTDVQHSLSRAESFCATAKRAGVSVETQLWTGGPYDGLLLLSAPDETTAAGVVLGLARQGNVSTCMLRAYDAGEFKQLVGKAGA
ncbi:MAG: hypothetical protein CHACPFDD_00712 [Phycisphaerae bacterium]|nr:hypothetical protein [Phycisphaerae bacterium]